MKFLISERVLSQIEICNLISTSKRRPSSSQETPCNSPPDFPNPVEPLPASPAFEEPFLDDLIPGTCSASCPSSSKVEALVNFIQSDLVSQELYLESS